MARFTRMIGDQFVKRNIRDAIGPYAPPRHTPKRD
jgi:hypothetical protein